MMISHKLPGDVCPNCCKNEVSIMANYTCFMKR